MKVEWNCKNFARESRCQLVGDAIRQKLTFTPA